MQASFIAIESFFDPACAAEIWPESIANSDVFTQQIEQRKELNKRLNDILNSLPRPDMPLEIAIYLGYVIEKQIIEIYTSLSVLLESDRDHRRLVLYLPFEFLPRKTWHPIGEELRQASGRFRHAYMEAWESLLSVHDVRANFVDGDVLEVQQRTGDLPRVVKAAHLIPNLVESGLMEVKDALFLMEENDDQILRDSIADTLPVLADLGLLDERELKFMEKSKDRLINNMARIIASNMAEKKRQIRTVSRILALQSVHETLNEEFSRIDDENIGDVTEKRAAWLRQKKKQEIMENSSKAMSRAISTGALTNETVAVFLSSKKSIASQQTLIDGIRKAIEDIARSDLGKAQALYEQYMEILLKLWRSNDSDINKTLLKTFRRLRQLGIANNKQLIQLGVSTPNLAGPFSENLKLVEEVYDIRKMIAAIELNPELSRIIYPVILIFGSRLNGYGEQGADIDLSVLVRPGTSFNNRARLKELLKTTFLHEKVRTDEIVEFWLEEKEGRLKVCDFSEPDVSLGQSYWAHILFGAAWEGKKDVIRELCEKLLVPYMHYTGEVLEGRDARSLYLEEIERSTLQYRLMHKGYECFFPQYGGIHTPHSDEIDGKSMFWDSGYRQLATKLFVSRVFLPKIPIYKI